MGLTNLEVETLTAVKTAARKLAKEDIDWEQRRYELVKELLPTIRRETPEEMVNAAIYLADTTIKALRLTHKNPCV